MVHKPSWSEGYKNTPKRRHTTPLRLAHRRILPRSSFVLELWCSPLRLPRPSPIELAMSSACNVVSGKNSRHSGNIVLFLYGSTSPSPLIFEMAVELGEVKTKWYEMHGDCQNLDGKEWQIEWGVGDRSPLTKAASITNCGTPWSGSKIISNCSRYSCTVKVWRRDINCSYPPGLIGTK